MTTTQLRDYRIEQAHFDEFLEAWRSQVPALREQYGFRSQAWSVPEEARFVWILSRDGTREAFEAADASYYASSERAAFDPDPAEWITDQEHRFLSPIVAGSVARRAPE